jgi:hypothetical protein
MAAYHYEMLLKQTPRNSTAANNLSVIYDEMGAVTTKISLLREAQRRKDSAYVSANLATAYAKAGFIRDATNYLEQVPVGEQQENIVQAAYRTVSQQTESDHKISQRLHNLVNIQKGLIGTKALAQLSETDKSLLQQFVGEWQLGDTTVVRITMDDEALAAEITTENNYYEHAGYKVRAQYQPGLLELNAELDEASLKQRPTPKGVYGLTGNALRSFAGLGGSTLLSGALSRPHARVKLILLPGERDTLYGLKANALTNDGSEHEPQLLLNAEEVHLTKLVHGDE